jgi:hypothetical protein
LFSTLKLKEFSLLVYANIASQENLQEAKFWREILSIKRISGTKDA